MTWTEYRLLTLKDMKARRWRTRRVLTTRGGGSIDAGREVRVVGKHGGLEVVAPRCEHCGVSFTARQVDPDALEEILP